MTRCPPTATAGGSEEETAKYSTARKGGTKSCHVDMCQSGKQGMPLEIYDAFPQALFSSSRQVRRPWHLVQYPDKATGTLGYRRQSFELVLDEPIEVLKVFRCL